MPRPGPPVQPVFTSQTFGRVLASFVPEQPRVDGRRCGRNGPPKHGENVGSGSVTPISVPASRAVKPARNQ